VQRLFEKRGLILLLLVFAPRAGSLAFRAAGAADLNNLQGTIFSREKVAQRMHKKL